MKLRVASYGIAADHEQITELTSILGARALSDFDAVIIDPSEIIKEFRTIGIQEDTRTRAVSDVSGELRSNLKRVRQEMFELLLHKGGVAIVVLDENTFQLQTNYLISTGRANERFGIYFLFESALAHVGKKDVLWGISAGSGDQLRIVERSAPSYLQILKKSLFFRATIVASRSDKFDAVFARDSVGRIVSGEIKVGPGSLLLVPATEEKDRKRVGSAIVQTVRERLTKEVPDESPAWLRQFAVPGQHKHDDEIKALQEENATILQQIASLENDKDSLAEHLRLLFTTGKHILEPAVRRAFRVLGYTVSEPDTYAGEWDVEMQSLDGRLVIGEVEGPEGAVDVDKFRQILDYHNDRVLAGADNKAVLIGNAHRLISPVDRPEAFTKHAIKGALKFDIALISTPDLFRAVCEVLNDPSEERKTNIQKSILACAGVWSWPPQIVPSEIQEANT